MNVLIITTEWPDITKKIYTPFLVQQINYLRKAGVKINVFHFRGNGNPINYVKAWLEVRRQKSWKEADLIHAHWGQSGLPALLSHKRLVVTFHGSDLQGTVNQADRYTISGKLLVAISKYIARKADYCIAVSKRVEDKLPVGIKSEVIPCGLNLELFRPLDNVICRDQLALEKSKKYILFVADPGNPIKRYHLAKDAVELVKKEYDAELLVVNGFEHEQIPQFMNAGDALILTSTHEGSPTVVKEGLACNLPIVSVDVGDVRERTQGIDGCEICEATPNALAEGIKKVLKRGKRLDAFEKIQFLDESKIVQRIIDVYQHVLADQK